MATAPHFDGTQLCTQTDPEVFFPETDYYMGTTFKNSIEKAKAICKDCHFIEPCLEYALNNDVEGIWGATVKKERVALRIDLGIPRPRAMSLITDKYAKQKSAR